MTTETTKKVHDRLDISKRAMLVNLSFGSWRATKLDKKETAAVQSKTRSDAFRTYKTLIDKSALDAITKNQNAARAWHNSHTVPFDDKGRRVLSAKIFLDYVQELNAFKATHDKLVSDFIKAYPEIVKNAKAMLNGGFNADDYPEADVVESKFRFETEVEPIPAAGHFLVTLQEGEVDKVASQIESTVQAKLNAGMQSVWKRLYDCVQAMAEKLPKFDPDAKEAKDRGTFRNSLVTNLKELCDILPALNLNDDDKLNQMCNDAVKQLTRYTADGLRHSEAARTETAKAAQELIERMSNYA